MSKRAILDSCFIIDWSKFKKRDTLFEVFEAVYITPDVLNELKSEDVIAWIGEKISSGEIIIYEADEEEKGKALEFVEATRKIPHYPSADFVEALGLIIAKRYNMILISENRAVLYAPLTFPEFSSVSVWRGIDILAQIARDCSELDQLIDEYEAQTLRRYSKKVIERARERCKGNEN